MYSRVLQRMSAHCARVINLCRNLLAQAQTFKHTMGP